jgi:hypothetical protein
MHHSSVLSGKEVTGAGSYKTDAEGNLTQITNKSGHYKPGIAKLIQSVETLLRQGAFLDKSWEGGDRLTGKQKELFEQTKTAILKASNLQVQVRKRTLAIDRELEQNPNANVDTQANALAAKSLQLKKQLDALTKAQQILAKLGVTQRNKITGEVEYLDVGADMTGIEIRTARLNTEGVEAFLKTGGGYWKPGDSESAASHKDATLTELKAKSVERRRELDAAEEKSATKELPHDVDDVLKELADSLGKGGKKQGQGATTPTSTSRKDRAHDATSRPAEPSATAAYYGEKIDET